MSALITPQRPAISNIRIASCCPTCGQHAAFTLIGEQRYPERVAKITGIEKLTMWSCEHCQTTLSNLDQS